MRKRRLNAFSNLENHFMFLMNRLNSLLRLKPFTLLEERPLSHTPSASFLAPSLLKAILEPGKTLVWMELKAGIHRSATRMLKRLAHLLTNLVSRSVQAPTTMVLADTTGNWERPLTTHVPLKTTSWKTFASNKSKLLFVLCSLLLFPLTALHAQDAQLLDARSFPEIKKLQKGDPLFDQLLQSVGAYHEARANKQPLPQLMIFRYQVTKGETLFGIAARLNLPHASITSLNRLSSADFFGLPELLIPTIPGLFVPANPRAELERLVSDRLSAPDPLAFGVHFIRDRTVEHFVFHPDADYTPAERKTLLGHSFRSPLPVTPRISSPFGSRRNPFSGELTFHAGVDLVAPYGTPIMAIGDGQVLETGRNEVYGNYVRIDHFNKTESFYAHMQVILVTKGQIVRTGETIGKLGNTGETTGAHLHVEIHENGMAKDPLLFFRL